MIQWTITAVALAGLVLNIAKRWQGYLLWCVSNAYWAYYNYQADEYAQAALFAVFWIASVAGVTVWKRKRNRE
ncbi:MAG: hypothetical protein ACYS74_21630 [Planctomycetota bacterium]|jgi:hypothetical protein